MEGAFRKIDIDQYDEDVLLDSELYDADPRDPAQVLDEAKQRAAAVRTSLSKCVYDESSDDPIMCVH
jgi:actin related protein 2/3 complex, subunit 5